MPAVSVLIPCYNVAATVDETLSSLVRQSLSDFEAVVVDDGSTDQTLERLQRWQTHDQRIRVLTGLHMGIIPALNTGLEACRSEYIARLDADDRCTPNRLNRQVEMLTMHPEFALVSSLIRGFPQDNLGADFRAYIDWLNGLQFDKDIKHGIFLQSPLAHPSVAYRKEWVERVGGYQDHSWAEDYDLWMRLYLAGANFGKVDEVLLEWRDHPRRLTHTDERYSKQSDLRLKAHYLMRGPLSSGKQVVIYGTGATASMLGELLLHLGCPLAGYVGSPPVSFIKGEQTVPVISIEKFFNNLCIGQSVMVLVVENDPQSKKFIGQKLETMEMRQGIDWLMVG